VLGLGIFSIIFGSLYVLKFVKRKSLRGGEFVEISDLEMVEEDQSSQGEGNAEII